MAQDGNDSLYMVIPAYNERDTIRQVITEWHAAAEGALDAMHKTGEAVRKVDRNGRQGPYIALIRWYRGYI